MVKKFYEYNKGEMIKKYNQFNEENKIANNNITKVVSKDDMDDQLLRLKEVLNCDIAWDYMCRDGSLLRMGFYDTLTSGGSIVVHVAVPDEFLPKTIIYDSYISEDGEIIKECVSIKNRMEDMFPVYVEINTKLNRAEISTILDTDHKGYFKIFIRMKDDIYIRND
jgi:hypothetical protein